MPSLHRYLGNPVLTGLGQLFFRSPVHDFHCGMRGFRNAAILNLNLRTTGMEFASEMVVKATLARLRLAEVPVTLASDGWRHLRFLLLYSPRWLLSGPRIVLGVPFDVHTLLYAAMALVVGFQGTVFTNIFAASEGLLPEDPRLTRLFRYVILETGLLTGSIYALHVWIGRAFGPLDPSRMLRLIIPPSPP